MCQVHKAVSALVTSWWLELPLSRRLLDAAAQRIRYDQANLAASRKGHRKRTLRRYHALGIKLSQTRSCRWPDK